jgi:hypothetical protein
LKFLSKHIGRGPSQQAAASRGLVHQLRETNMRTNRSALGALFAAVTIAACDGADPSAPEIQARVEDAGHSETVHVASTVALDETFESPCNGEIIHLTGTLREQANYVGAPPVDPDQGFFVHGEHLGVVDESGTGLTTGLTYTFRDSFHELFNSPSQPAANFVFTYNETGRLTTDAPGLSITMHFLVHGLGLPTGEFKVTREIERLECR